MRKTPLCRNPQHPAGKEKRMIFLEQKGETFVFACQACKDVNKVMSVQVVTSAALKQEIRKQLAREGKILNRPAPIVRRMPMDESLMRERGRIK